MIQAIVFDLDGVLLDTREANYQAFRFGLERAGCAVPERPAVASLIGLPAIEMLECLGCPPGLSHDIYYRYVQPHYVDHLADLASAFPQALEVLSSLREQGYGLSACTSGDSPTQERALQATGLRGLLSHLQTPDRSAFKKPDPRYLAEAVACFGSPARVLHVEDTEGGLRMGREFGAVTIFAEYGYGCRGAEAPDHVLASLAELLELVRSL